MVSYSTLENLQYSAGAVLILVVVDNGLVHEQGNNSNAIVSFVLILVVVDNGLVRNAMAITNIVTA